MLNKVENKAEIVHAIDIKTTPVRLYEAITAQKGLASWWTPQTKAKAEAGAVNEFDFAGTTLKFRVEKLESPRLIIWSAVEVPSEWKGTQVRFEIAPDGEKVNLRFSHTGFASTDGNFGVTSYSWAQHIRSIKLLLETGRGEPHGSKGSRLAGTT